MPAIGGSRAGPWHDHWRPRGTAEENQKAGDDEGETMQTISGTENFVHTAAD